MSQWRELLAEPQGARELQSADRAVRASGLVRRLVAAGRDRRMTVSTDSKLSLVSRVGEWQTVPRKLQAVSLSRRPLRLLIEFLAERFGGALAPWDRELRRPWPRSVKASRKPT